jgi:Family of unknown function (DUF5317)
MKIARILLICGMVLFVLGAASNITVRTANGGAMPVKVRAEEITSSGVFPKMNLPTISSLENPVRFYYLSDIILFGNEEEGFYVSIGDILLCTGYLIAGVPALFIAWEMDKKRKLRKSESIAKEG